MVQGEGPEYETIALCGSNCGIGDIAALVKFNELCDEWGMDTISSGSVLGLAMDLTEKGIKDFGVRFGDVESYLKAPELMATRTGVGRGAGARLEAPGREVRRARAGHGGQEPRAARATTRAAPSA